MADDKQKEDFKKEAAAKAKAAALAKLNRDKDQIGKKSESRSTTDGPVVKINTKTKEPQSKGIKTSDRDDEEKMKAIAKAKAKAAAAAKARATVLDSKNIDKAKVLDEEKANKAVVKKIDATPVIKENSTTTIVGINKTENTENKPEVPSVNQPLLDLIQKEVTNKLGSNIIEELYINKLSNEIPTLVASKDNFYKLAKTLKECKSLDFNYINLLQGTDFQSHMEVYVQLRSYKNGFDVALKTKLDREYPEVDSLTSLWIGASWPESETYDLLGIKFIGNPDLHRIFLGENWVGYPLRKDYQPYEEEVLSE